MPRTWQRIHSHREAKKMALGTGPAMRKAFADKLTGADGTYSAWELAFFAGYNPKSASSTLYTPPLVAFQFTTGWAFYQTDFGVTLTRNQTQNVTTAGECTFFRFNAVVPGSRIALLHGSVSKNGAGGDIQFSDTGWPVGLPIKLDALYIRPPPLQS